MTAMDDFHRQIEQRLEPVEPTSDPIYRWMGPILDMRLKARIGRFFRQWMIRLHLRSKPIMEQWKIHVVRKDHPLWPGDLRR